MSNYNDDYEYVDEDGNVLTEKEVAEYKAELEDESKFEKSILEEEFKEEDIEHNQEDSKRKRSFADLASNQSSKTIFQVKDNVDNLINKGKTIKDVFIKEANLLETEEAEILMREAFEKIENIRTRKTGFLGLSDKFLPESVNKLVQTTAMKVEQKKRNDKDVVEISNDLFDLMQKKQEDVENSAVKFIEIKNQMQQTVLELSKEAQELEEYSKSEDLSESDVFNANRVLTLISNNILTFEENIQNINAAQNMAMQCIMHIDQMLPTIENSMKDSLAINAFLNKINSFKDNFTLIAEITNKIQNNNSESIHDMIRNTGNFDKLLSTNAQGISDRNKAKKELTIEMKKQQSKEKILAAELRNTIVDAQEELRNNQADIFSSGDSTGDYYIPERIDLSNQIENKKKVRQIKIKSKKQKG